MKRNRLFLSLLALFAFLLSACGDKAPQPETASSQPIQPVSATSPPQEQIVSESTESMSSATEEEANMKLKIGETDVSVQWEDNESVAALKGLAADGPLTISMSMYGGFEQVGSIGQSLPRNDCQTTTQTGDIMLYSGNQIVIFYGSNSWAYTRLGRVTDLSAADLTELLGSGDVEITLSLR